MGIRLAEQNIFCPLLKSFAFRNLSDCKKLEYLHIST